jgi:hypothetical protein
MKTIINKFFAMATLFLIGGLVAPEIKAQNLSAASWIKWYKPDPKDASKNIRVYRTGTSEEISQIATNVKNGKVIGGKTYELPGASSIRFTLTEPNLWYDYWLKSYQDIDKTVTRENMPEVMAKDDVLYWDNNFSGVTAYNYYFSQNSKTVKYVSDYSGLAEKVPVLVHNGKIVGKMDCFNPLLLIKKQGSIEKIEKEEKQQIKTIVRREEKKCYEITERKVRVFGEIPSATGDYTGHTGLRREGWYLTTVYDSVEVSCEQSDKLAGLPRETKTKKRRSEVRKESNGAPVIVNIGVALSYQGGSRNQGLGGTVVQQQDGFTSVTPGKQGGGTVVTPGGQSGGFQPVTPGKRLGQ